MLLSKTDAIKIHNSNLVYLIDFIVGYESSVIKPNSRRFDNLVGVPALDNSHVY